MAEFFTSLTREHIAFIRAQKMFFIGSCAGGRDVNISPKGGVPLHVLGANMATYLDFHGSGSRTAEDVAEGSPVTVMFCSFDATPSILRLYCTGEILKPGDLEFAALFTLWEGVNINKARQIFLLKIIKVQTSCGYGVPVFRYAGERETGATEWATY